MDFLKKDIQESDQERLTSFEITLNASRITLRVSEEIKALKLIHVLPITSFLSWVFYNVSYKEFKRAADISLQYGSEGYGTFKFNTDRIFLSQVLFIVILGFLLISFYLQTGCFHRITFKEIRNCLKLRNTAIPVYSWCLIPVYSWCLLIWLRILPK